MNKILEYTVVCPACHGERTIAAQDVPNILTELMCQECGHDRQPVLRSAPRRPGFSGLLPALAELFHRPHAQL